MTPAAGGPAPGLDPRIPIHYNCPMDVRTLEALDFRRALYPRRFLAVYRRAGRFVIHNLLNGAKRSYADPRDVLRRVGRG